MSERWMKIVELPRPYLFVVPAAAGICGLFLLEQNPSIMASALATFIPVLAWAGGQVFNDYFDAEIDAQKHPKFPIPSGMISKKMAVVYGLSFYLASLFLSALASIYCILACLLAILFSYIYGYEGKSKRKGFPRNLCFGLAVAMCVLIGSTIMGNASILTLAVMIIVVLIYTSDNIIGRLPDVKLDRQMGIQTLPLQIGLKPAAGIAFMLTVAATVITMLLWLLGLNIRYLPTAIIASLSLVWVAVSVFKDPEGSGNLPTILLRYMGQLLLYLSLIIGAIK